MESQNAGLFHDHRVWLSSDRMRMSNLPDSIKSDTLVGVPTPIPILVCELVVIVSLVKMYLPSSLQELLGFIQLDMLGK